VRSSAAELVQGLKEGMVLDGVVKNITDYGAFVDLGGVDGLLHVTDIAWRRINHPSEALTIGQPVKVQVIRFNSDTQRISLGMKQLMSDPWDGVAIKYPVNGKFSGRVTNITDYGAFVELEAGVEGLVHVSEMSWTKKNVHPGKIVATSEQVDVLILDVDEPKRRISLGLKQAQGNPWEVFLQNHPLGSDHRGRDPQHHRVRPVHRRGPGCGWHGPSLRPQLGSAGRRPAIANYKKGDVVKAKVLDVDVEKERISLGIKQLAADPAAEVLDKVKKGDIVTCTVTKIEANGIEVKIDEVLTGFIRRAELARDRQDQRPDKFAIGEKVDAKITAVDRAARRLSLTVKGKEIEEEREAVKEFGTADSGASLGDILGAAIRRRRELAGEE
jgi:small subunit ribosomal protein S1